MAIPLTTTVYGKSPLNPTKNTTTKKVEKLTGFAYPFEENPKRGYYSKSNGIELLRANLRQLIRTEKGERFMLPEYGCNLKRFLMEPLDETTFNEVKNTIKESIARYLGKVQITKLQVFETASGAINIKLFCSYKDEEFTRFETEIRI